MAEVPPRYLVACLGARGPEHEALLRFPPCVTLEDAGCDWAFLFEDMTEPTIPADALGRLSGLGVKVVAAGEEAASEAFQRVMSPRSSLGAFADDYLGVNARLGGERCVTVREYAMHTWLRGGLLRDVLRRHLRHRDGVRIYGDTAFREGSLPDILCLPVVDIARHELSRPRRLFVPCRLHGDGCRSYRHDIIPGDTGAVIEDAMSSSHAGARVAVPRRLLDDMRCNDGLRVAGAAREIARLVLGTLPDEAWIGRSLRPYAFDAVVATVAAETCEEYKMLLEALRGCRSAREIVRRARDASWVVSRALERIGGGQ